MKPSVKGAMEHLIAEARRRIPFHLSFDGNCEGRCDECAFKLMEFLDMDLSGWEYRLKQGETPKLDDVHALAQDCKKVYAILYESGLLKEPLE